MEERLSNGNDHSWRNKNPTSYPVLFSSVSQSMKNDRGLNLRQLPAMPSLSGSCPSFPGFLNPPYIGGGDTRETPDCADCRRKNGAVIVL